MPASSTPDTARAAFLRRLTANKALLGLKTVAPYKGQFQDAARKSVDLGEQSPAAFVLQSAGELGRNLSAYRLSVLLFVRDRALRRDEDEALALAEALGRWLLENRVWQDGGRTYSLVEDAGVGVALFAQASAYAVYAVTVTVDQCAV